MDRFITPLKELSVHGELSDEQVAYCFDSAGMINKAAAENAFKKALRRVAGWDRYPLCGWAFRQALDNEFPVLRTEWYEQYWETKKIQALKNRNDARIMELVQTRSLNVTNQLLTEEEVFGRQQQQNIHNNNDQVEISGPVEEQQNVYDNEGGPEQQQQQQQTNNNNVHNENDDGEQSTVFVHDDNEQQSGDLYGEGYEYDDNECNDTQDKFPSDLTENYHKNRTSEYRIASICKYDGPQEENGEDVGEDRSSWVIEEFNFDVSEQLTKARLSCLYVDSKTMSDTRLLMLNHIYLFNHEDTQNSVIKYIDFFGEDYNEERGLKLMRILQNRHSYEEQKVNISDNANLWCSTLAQHTKDDWYKIQETTMPFLLQAAKSNNKTDLIVANILHQQALEFCGNKSTSTFEDAYVHRCISSLFKAVFQSDPLFSYDWANGTLLGKRAHGDSPYRPDFVAFISNRRDVAVAEVKPVHNSKSSNFGESDLVKIGRMMRIMYNDLVEAKIPDPAVGGLLVEGDTLRTFVLSLEYSKKYELIELSQSKLYHNMSTLTLLPALVNNMLWLKNIIKPTAVRVLRHQTQKTTNSTSTHSYSPYLSYLDHDDHSLVRVKKQKKN